MTVGGGLACWLNAAHAATTYSYFYVAGQPEYDVVPGTTVEVPLYLQEVNSDGSSNSLLASEDGLSAAGVSVSFLAASDSGPTSITGILANASSPTSGFDYIQDSGQATLTSTYAALSEATNYSDTNGVAAGTQTNGQCEVFLGTLQLQASAASYETTTFNVGVYNLDNGTTQTADPDYYDLDNNTDPFAGNADLYSSATSSGFSVVTIPEPASLSLLAVGAMPLVQRSRRRSIDRRRR